VIALWDELENVQPFLHPIYPLLRVIRWHDGWSYEAAKDTRGRGVKATAYESTERAFRHAEMRRLADAVRQRRAAWVEPRVRDGMARRLSLQATTEFVLHLSSPGPLELGMAVHHVYGLPYLPATGLKGLCRAVAAENAGLAERLYGRQDVAGQVVILDGLPVNFEVRRDVMTPHFPDWYAGSRGAKPDDTSDPRPLPFLSVAKGSEFEVVLLALSRNTAAVDLEQVENHLRQGCDERGLGAKTAAGYGAFQVTKLESPLWPRAATTPDSAPGSPSPRTDQTATAKKAPRPVDSLMQRVRALSPHRVVSEINQFVDQCLELQEVEDQRALASAIVQKMTEREIRRRIKEGKRPEQWRRILNLAGVEGS
jgi:CRISPR-associated protein Cmr6